jgi:head-tail adaptor
MSNTHNRRTRPNNRHRIRFYTPSEDTVSSGELTKQFTLVTSGYFAKEKPLRPREVIEGARNVPEQDFLLIGQWTKSLSEVTAGYIAWDPTENKAYAVNGNAFDPWGDKKKIHIYITDNVTQELEESDFEGV